MTRRNLQPKQFGSEGMPPEDAEIVDAANRRMAGGPVTRGPIGPFDADNIDRNNKAMADMSDFGMPVTPTFTRSEENRGFSVDVGIPDVSVIINARSRGGFGISVHHGARYETDESGNYRYPEDWGQHSEDLNVSEHELSGAVMDYLSRPDVRRHMVPPGSQ